MGLTKNARQVGLISLGCSKNQVDAERMLASLADEGFVICGDIDRCDAVIVNTCGFIEDAKKESIEAILEAATHKTEGGRLKVLAITGCLAERYQAEMAEQFPEADVILGMGSMADIAGAISRALSGERVISFGDKAALPLEGGRLLANAPHFAYLKVAEGCDNRCSYCAIPLIRGPFRSRPMEEVVAEAERLVAQGVVELNVVAQDTTRYGEDLYGRLALPELLRKLCAIPGVGWVRLLYCYPDRVTDELIDTIATEEKVVNYIDLPLQHVDGALLHAMNRRGDHQSLSALLQTLRARIPGVAIRTTFIAGLPGEDEAAFERLCGFVRAQAFERLGCFAYSPEEDTPAFSMAGRPDEETRLRRAEHIMELQMDIAAGIARASEGQTLTVLCDGYDDEANCWVGRSYMDAPDIDTRVYFTGDDDLAPGRFVSVEITGSDGYDLVGEQREDVR